MSESIKKITIFDNGYASLITEKGTIVGYPDTKVLGKKISEITNDKKILELPQKIAENKITDYIKEDERNELISEYITIPFEIGHSGINWGADYFST